MYFGTFKSKKSMHTNLVQESLCYLLIVLNYFKPGKVQQNCSLIVLVRSRIIKNNL